MDDQTTDEITVTEEDLITIFDIYKFVPEAYKVIPGAHAAMSRMTDAFMRAHVQGARTISIVIDDRYKPYPDDIEFLKVIGFINADGSRRAEYR